MLISSFAVLWLQGHDRAFVKEALEVYRDAAVYSEEHFGLGEAFVRAVEAALAVIKDDPVKFQSVGDGVRIFRLKRFPYYLYYHEDLKRDAITLSTPWPTTADVLIIGESACASYSQISVITRA